MKRVFAPQAACFQWVMMFLMTALVARALIPIGFMPGEGAGGAPTMVICAGMEQKTIPADAGDDHAAKSQSMPCGFAVNAQAVETPAFIVTPALTAWHILPLQWNRLPVTTPRIQPPARAPPVFS